METNDLQKREVFHLVFLRALVPGPAGQQVVLKGGCNLRFFYGSIRYSEDMDLDVADIEIAALSDRVMAILTSEALHDALRTYGIVRLTPPNMRVAKQTATVQRFKVHLFTATGTDLSTKVEFSRRGYDDGVVAEGVTAPVLGVYRLPPLVVRHYGPAAAIRQKLQALMTRAEPQARDVFDLYTLSSQPEALSRSAWHLSNRAFQQVRETILAIDFPEYRDTVVSYLGPDDLEVYGTPEMWDTIRLTVVSKLEAADEQ